MIQASKTTKYENPVYETYCSFTSHESEFDYLKSLEIEEKINKIRWLPQQSQARHLLSTNDKTIKLWRLSERTTRATGYNLRGTCDVFEETYDEEYNLTTAASQGDTTKTRVQNAGNLRVPKYEQRASLLVEANPRRVFANAHAYHINSISINSDQETFLSADDLRINLWNLNVTNQSFNIVDIKPTNMEELCEVITTAEFHPTSCSLFMYSSSKGILRLCDMRQRALCDNCTLTFHEQDTSLNRGFFSEIVNSIADLKFSNSGRYVLIWDLNMTDKPIEVYQVHDHLRSKFVALYENDCIFDKFECAWSPGNNYVLTGSYNNLFRIFDRSTGKGVFNEVDKAFTSTLTQPLRTREVTCDSVAPTADQISVDAIDFTKKLLYLIWHPNLPRIAMTSNENLFLVSAHNQL
ncbi:unnamed protein product [Mesocestoides corti]|uniref:Serine/threonine-protein phosphatase 2A 55 kDa regulatory subunit B n=1 Tax=Mesocestoides corti TaxID=53468 RepID=A0A158QWC8_MESCO|nr:unnamed protein product [Mesocestoides corti]